MSQDVLSSRDGAVGIVTLNRPQVRNAVHHGAMDEIRQAVEAFDADPEVRAIVVTGSGTAFCAGADIDFMDDVRNSSAQQIRDRVYKSFQGATRAIRLTDKPVVAAVNGPAFGAGCELAVICDFRIAAEEAVFCENWVAMGALAPLGGVFLLPRLVGLERASRMLMAAEEIGGAEAVQIGLASEVVPRDQVMPQAIALAARMAAMPAASVTAAKRALRRSVESTLASEWEYYVNVQATLLTGPDFRKQVDDINARIRGAREMKTRKAEA